MRIFNKFHKTMCRYAKSVLFRDKQLYFSAFERTFVNAIVYNEHKSYVSESTVNRGFLHSGFDDRSIEEFSEKDLENELTEEADHARNLLFKNSKDKQILELNKCVSVEEVLKFLLTNSSSLDDKHLTHTVLVLRDLQILFTQYNDSDHLQFIETLYNKKEFTFLLTSITNKLQEYNYQFLSYTVLYLNKLGLPSENENLQSILWELRKRLLEQFSLDVASKLLRVTFTEHSVRPYYYSKEIVPKVFSEIAASNSADHLENLTTCLNKLHNFVTKAVLDEYTDKIEEFLKVKKLRGENYKVLLKIIMFLNYPKWRNEKILLITKCIGLMEDHIYLLNSCELQTLYEVFFKNQQPGHVLNIIQRTSANLLQHLDEEFTHSQTDSKLRLFSSLIYFSSPLHRIQFRKDVGKYLTQCKTLESLILLRKIFSYIKVSDEKLCKHYWDKTMRLLKENLDLISLTKFSENYMNFNIDINNYRHFEFENVINREINRFAKNGELFLYPSVFSTLLSFFIVYGKSTSLLHVLITRLNENYTQIGVTDCLKLSRSLNLLEEVQNNYVTRNQYRSINNLLALYTKNKVADGSRGILENSVLIKGAILRGDVNNNELLDDMLMKFKELDYMSSKILENICYYLVSTNSLIPEVINKCTEYVVNNKDHILGFNAEKILFVCFNLNYYPINSDRFFECIINILIRDQERLSGLAFLQSALSLSFFNRLPKSFVKQIFNVEFLDKLDTELANCYSKDKYPQRVRSSLMWLNRSVCLEYPEYNIPWFHQKYIEELQKKAYYDDTFFIRFKDYLIQVLGRNDVISQNVVTPYGYHIDFVVNIDCHRSVDDTSSFKLAIILVRDRAFTRFYNRLKGKYELKKRHLEILGYRVKIVRFNEWNNLLYGGERFEFVEKLLYPEKFGL